MINLLPPATKESYRFARRNTRLVGWVVAFSFAIAGLAAIGVGGVLILQQQAKGYDSQVTTAEEKLRAQNQAGTEKQVKDISDNLKLAVQVLSKEVLFSQLLRQMAVIIPGNATLANLNINQVQGALDITANTTDYNAATQLQVNLADPANKIFSKADIVSINCASSTNAIESPLKARYPCTVTLRALFAPNNPYLFISNSKAKATP